jgi:hypothetical protein
MVVIASSHLLLVTNEAVIGGACEITSVVSKVTNNRCELASTTNYCSIRY